MRFYLAHPVSDYGGTPRQVAASKLIEDAGHTVENPDQPIHQQAYKAHGMDHFIEVVEGCDALAFLRFADGSIGAGVGKEIEAALRAGIPVYDASDGRLEPTGLMIPEGILSVEETRAKLGRA